VAKRRRQRRRTMTENNGAPVANLAAARKEQAAARRAHPAGKKAPAKAPAKKAAAKAPAKKAAPKVPSNKVRWTRLEDKTGAVEQDASCGAITWQLRRKDDGWTVKQDGKLLTPKPVAYAAAGRLIVEAARKAVAA
jgi:hypothetical protein